MAFWLSRRIRIVSHSMILMVALLMGLRLILLVSGEIDTEQSTWLEVMHALLTGIRFDLQLVIASLLPFVIVFLLPLSQVVFSRITHVIFSTYVSFLSAAWVGIYFFDYVYLHEAEERLQLLNFEAFGGLFGAFEATSARYPLEWIGLGLMCLALVVFWMHRRSVQRTMTAVPISLSSSQRISFALVFIFLVGVGLLGRVPSQHGLQPFEKSTAYRLHQPQLAVLAQNPVLNLLTDSVQGQWSQDPENVKEAYQLLASNLGISWDDKQARNSTPGENETLPNVVIVKVAGLNTRRLEMGQAQHIKALSKQGVLLSSAYQSTAPESDFWWNMLSGVPAVNGSVKKLSANNAYDLAFPKHAGYYFTGGSMNSGLHAFFKGSSVSFTTFEENDYSLPLESYSGVQDSALLGEVSQLLKKAKWPFLALLDTGIDYAATDNNRLARLDKRLFDFVQKLPTNTVLVLVGVVEGEANRYIPPHRLATERRVPVIIYAHNSIQPFKSEISFSTMDILPIVARQLKLAPILGGMSRDIQLSSSSADLGAYIQSGSRGFPNKAWLQQGYYSQVLADGSSASLHDLKSNSPSANIADSRPAKFAQLRTLAESYYVVAADRLRHGD